MSGVGQTEKNLVRANVFRFALELGHCPMKSALRICAEGTDSDSVSPLYHSASARLSLGESRSASPSEYQGVCKKSKAFSRLFAAASRLPRGAKSQRVSMNFKIDVVSYVVLSTKRRLA